VVIDEAQDLTPMQLRAVRRRSQNSWLTVVGDLGQASGEWQHSDWEEVFSYLAPEQPFRATQLPLTYRVPDLVMDVAQHVLNAAAPELEPTESVLDAVDRPQFTETKYHDLFTYAAEEAARCVAEDETTAIIVAESQLHAMRFTLDQLGLKYSNLLEDGIRESGITLVRSVDSKGLEFASVVIVEPDAIVQERPLGLRVLYVAITRAMKRLRVVYADPLPASLAVAEEQLMRPSKEDAPIISTSEVEAFLDDQSIQFVFDSLRRLSSEDVRLVREMVERLRRDQA
jgi:DNA helicase IV